MFELYTILRIKPTTTDEEIHQAFRKLAKETHPDLNPNDEDKQELFKQIKVAYDTLSDPEKRKKYDETQQSLQKPVDDIKEQFLTLLNRKVMIKDRIIKLFFILAILIGFVFLVRQFQYDFSFLRILSVLKIKDPRWILIGLFAICIGILVFIFVEYLIILRIKKKIKKLLKEGKR